MLFHIKILLAYHTEKIHRKIFDEVYVHFDYKKRKGFTKQEKRLIKYYNFLVWINPKFRKIVKRYKETFRRAYYRRLLAAQYFYLYRLLIKGNYTRYN